MSKNKIVGAATGIIKPNYEKILETKAEKKNFYTVDNLSSITSNVDSYYDRISNVVYWDDTCSSGSSLSFSESIIYAVTNSSHVYFGAMFYPAEGAEFVIHCQNQLGVLIESAGMNPIYDVTGDTRSRWELKTGEALVIKCENSVLRVVGESSSTQIVLSDGVNKIKFPELKNDIDVGNIIGFDEMFYNREDGCLHIRKGGVDIVAPQFIGILSEKKMTLTDVSKIYEMVENAWTVEYNGEGLVENTLVISPNEACEILGNRKVTLSTQLLYANSAGQIYAVNCLNEVGCTVVIMPVYTETYEKLPLYFGGTLAETDEWGRVIIGLNPNECVAIEYDGERYNILGENGYSSQIALTDGTHKAVFPTFNSNKKIGDMIWENADSFIRQKKIEQHFYVEGDFALEENGRYAIKLNGDCNLSLPSKSTYDTDGRIEIFINCPDKYKISFGDVLFVDGERPVFPGGVLYAGVYRVICVYDILYNKWCVSVTEYREDWSEALGLLVDYENNVFERLEAAVGKTKGADFDAYPMYGGRKRCNVADDGTILAYEGDEGYTEDGTNGQVMVYQPAFYYKMIPLVLDGIKLRKAEYYISEKPLAGFKRHPAFYDINGNEIDYILLAAFEGCIYDADAGEDGSGAYVLQTSDKLPYAPNFADYEADKLSSVAGAFPYHGATVAQAEQMAKNRGEGWHIDHMLSLSVNQLLIMIEIGALNVRDEFEKGIIVGNLMRTGTNGQANSNGYTQALYRGCEGLWGNVGQFVGGYKFGADKNTCVAPQYFYNAQDDTLPWISMGTEQPTGWISAFAYHVDADWAFVPAESNGTSKLPVGSQCYGASKPTNEMGFNIVGYYLNSETTTGIFAYWATLKGGSGADATYSTAGSRLLYVPTAQKEEYV